MKILVIGQGGREHALVRATQAEYVFPGNDGILSECKKLPVVSPASPEEIARAAQAAGIELVIVGPEAELVVGYADVFRSRGLSVFGPSQAAAQLEASKIFSKNFMLEFGVPTARSFEVSSVEEALRAAENFSPPFVLKADGLAAGKGVFICENKNELEFAARKIFVEKILGGAGERALVEEFSPGEELSVLVATNGRDYEILPYTRDHKRLLEGDGGPNTGGMGVVGPIAVDESLKEKIRRDIVEKSLSGLRARGFDYRGILFIGVMVTPSGPSVLEYNVRFGDPETQVVLPLLTGSWRENLLAVARADRPWPTWSWHPQRAVACVVLAAEGYPEAPKKGVRIDGPALYSSEKGYLLHAGTRRSQDIANKGSTQIGLEGILLPPVFETNGGRVLNAIGLGENLFEALRNAYDVASKVSWPGMRMRRDIGLR